MVEPNVLARQRQALRAFPRAADETTQKLLEVTKKAEADASKAKKTAEHSEKQARAWLQQARDALATGREKLKNDSTAAYFLYTAIEVSFVAKASAGLEQAAATARQATADLAQAAEALKKLRAAQLAQRRREQLEREQQLRRRRRILAAIALTLCVILVIAAIRGLQNRRAQQYDAALAALEAGLWPEAREGFSALGGYQDSATMVAEAYYREAAHALDEGEREMARVALQQIPGYRDADTLLTMPAPTSTDLPVPTPSPSPSDAVTRSPTPVHTKLPSPTGALADTPHPTVAPTREPSPTPTPPCALPVDSELASAWTRERLGCPTTRSSLVWAAWEPFERGRMLWRSDNTDVYVLHLQDGTDTSTGNWQVYQDEWDGSNPNGVGLSPPAGLLEPVRGFGWVWREFLGGAQSQIGWARYEERGICIKVQSFRKGFIFRSSLAQCSGEYNRASELPLLLFALQGSEEGKWWRYGQ